jgi:hypothetical protein
LEGNLEIYKDGKLMNTLNKFATAFGEIALTS